MNLSGLRIGFGEDFHKIVIPARGFKVSAWLKIGRRTSLTKKVKPLKVGGIIVSDEISVIAHSDGDAFLHALIDALFGAASMSDIGFHFPNSPEFEDADSRELLKIALEKTSSAHRGFRIISIDSVVFLEGIKLSPYREAITNNLIKLLKKYGHEPRVNIKFKSWEGKKEFKDLYRATVAVLASTGEKS